MVRFTLYLDDDLAAAIDTARGDVPRNRFILRLLFRAIQKAEEAEVEAAGYA
jgi:hypothetical protein